MYIRIQQQSLCFRISMLEAKELLQHETLTNTTFFESDFTLKYQVVITAKASYLDTSIGSNRVTLFINKQTLADEIRARPSKKGIVFEIGKSKPLRVSLEVDLKQRS